MAIRRPVPIPNLAVGEWDEKKRRDLELCLRALFASISGMSTAASDPTEIQAGVAADQGAALSVALSDHTHDVDTAAPSVPVAFGGASDEGSGTALMRADATLVLEGGDDDGDVLVWDSDTETWVSTPGGNLLTESVASVDNMDALEEILTLLRSINYMIHESFNVPDDVDAIRRDMGSDNLIVNELRTLANLLATGLDIRPTD